MSLPVVENIVTVLEGPLDQAVLSQSPSNCAACNGGRASRSQKYKLNLCARYYVLAYIASTQELKLEVHIV